MSHDAISLSQSAYFDQCLGPFDVKFDKTLGKSELISKANLTVNGRITVNIDSEKAQLINDSESIYLLHSKTVPSCPDSWRLLTEDMKKIGVRSVSGFELLSLVCQYKKQCSSNQIFALAGKFKVKSFYEYVPFVSESNGSTIFGSNWFGYEPISEGWFAVVITAVNKPSTIRSSTSVSRPKQSFYSPIPAQIVVSTPTVQSSRPHVSVPLSVPYTPVSPKPISTAAPTKSWTPPSSVQQSQSSYQRQSSSGWEPNVPLIAFIVLAVVAIVAITIWVSISNLQRKSAQPQVDIHTSENLLATKSVSGSGWTTIDISPKGAPSPSGSSNSSNYNPIAKVFSGNQIYGHPGWLFKTFIADSDNSQSDDDCFKGTLVFNYNNRAEASAITLVASEGNHYVLCQPADSSDDSSEISIVLSKKYTDDAGVQPELHLNIVSLGENYITYYKDN